MTTNKPDTNRIQKRKKERSCSFRWIRVLVDKESTGKEQVAAAVQVREEGVVEVRGERAVEDAGRADGADDGALGAAAHGATHVELGGCEGAGSAGHDKGAEWREVHGVDGALGLGCRLLECASEGVCASWGSRAPREERDADGRRERVLDGRECVCGVRVCGSEVAACDAEDALELVDGAERVKDSIVLRDAPARTRVCGPCVATASVKRRHSSAGLLVCSFLSF